MNAAPPALPAELDAGFRRLRLGAMRRLSAELLVTANTQRWAPEEFLRTLIETELASRDASNARERMRQAPFPVTKTLEEFDVTTSSVKPATFEYLSSLEWVRAKENLWLVGPPGTGKCHLLVALGHRAVTSGLRVRYFTAAELVETLYRGMADNSVGRVIETILRADLVLIDEIGFAPLHSTGAQLFFRLVAGAFERDPGHRLALALRGLGPVPARAHDRRQRARPASPPRRRGGQGRNAKLVFRASLRLNATAAGIYSRPDQRLRALRRPPVMENCLGMKTALSSHDCRLDGLRSQGVRVCRAATEPM